MPSDAEILSALKGMSDSSASPAPSPIDDKLLDSIRHVESGGNKHAISPKGAMGPYQIMPFNVKEGMNPFDEKEARAWAKGELERLYKHYGSVEKAVAAYNAGEGAIDKGRMPAETKAYVPKVLGQTKDADILSQLHSLAPAEKKPQQTQAPQVSNQPKPLTYTDGQGTVHEVSTTTQANILALQLGFSATARGLQQLFGGQKSKEQVEYQQNLLQQLKDKYPKATFAEMLGQVLDPATAALPVGKVLGTAKGMVAGALGGATMGALAPTGKDESRVTNAAVGAMGGTIGGMLGSKIGIKSSNVPHNQAAPIPKFLNRLAAIGVGGATGYTLDKDHPMEGMVIGATLGAAVGTVNPVTIANNIDKIFEKDNRIRVDQFVDTHEHNIGRVARQIFQLQDSIESLAPEEASRIKITHWLDGDKSIILTNKEMQAAQQAKDFFKVMGMAGKKFGVLKSTLNDYITHLWKFGRQGEDLIGNVFGPTMSPKSQFAKGRTLTTIAQGKAAGLTPLTEDVSQILGIYGNSMARSIENARLLESLKGFTDGFGNKVIMAADKAPQNWKFINHPQMVGVKVHPDIAPTLKHLFDQRDPGVWTRAGLGLNMALKRTAVSFSMFHAKALTDAYIGAGGDVTKLPGIARGTDSLLRQIRSGGNGDIIDKALAGGLKFQMGRQAAPVADVSDSFYAGMKDLQMSMDSFIPGMGKLPKGFAEINHKIDDLMWGRLHTGMKLQIFSKQYEKFVAGGMPEKEAAEKAASYANDLFGGLNWRRIAEGVKFKWGRDFALAATSPTARRASQIMFFAPDWTISTTRAALKAFDGGLTGDALSRAHRMYILRSAAYYLTVGDALNYAFSGHHIWENEPHIPKGQEATAADKMDAMTFIDMGDGTRMQFSKHAIEPLHWAIKPGQQFLNKLGIIPSEVMEQALGKEYLSATAPPMQNRAEHLAARVLPFPLQGINQPGRTAGEQINRTIASAAGIPIYGMTEEERQAAKEARAEEKRKRRNEE